MFVTSQVGWCVLPAAFLPPARTQKARDLKEGCLAKGNTEAATKGKI